MKRTTTILVCTLAAGMAWAQNPQVIENTRAMMNSVQQKSTAASNEALGVKPAPAKQAAAKPATAPTKTTTVAVKTTAAPAKTTAAAVKTTAAPSKAAIVPAKATASASKATVVPVKASAPKVSASKVSAPKPSAVSTKSSVAKATPSSPKAEPFSQKKSTASASPKLGVKQLKVAKEIKPAGAQKEKKAVTASKATAPAAAASTDANSANSSSQSASDDPVKDEQDKKWAMSGKRDPFISPVVSHAGGSGCSTGKKCLEIGAINLRGVVHSDGGFIAVVTNNLNKAYFLRENDPVFDGYVVKITGDSIIFKETVQDRLGKSFTREVTKKITTPAV